MGYEQEREKSSKPPKLSLFSLPRQPPETPGMLTPPRRTSASVPFQWEEAPGKPRPFTTESKPTSVKSLELPPRLLSDTTKVTNTPSPTTVLDGPYIGRSLYSTWSFRRSEGWPKREDKEKASGPFRSNSTRRGSFRKNKEVLGGSFDFPSVVGGHGDVHSGSGGDNRINMAKARRRRSLLNLSNYTRSHLLAGIYQSFKQVVPWRRRQ